MQGTIANLDAHIRWELSLFERGTRRLQAIFTQIDDQIRALADRFQDFGRKMTLGVTLPLAGLAALMVNAASNAQELQAAFDETFGRLSETMNEWAEATGDAMDRSTMAMQEGAMALGQLFNAAAPTRDIAAQFAQDFTELAQDAASFFNVDFDSALGRLRSGLTGEAEPLRRFGVFLSAAAVEAKALELGIVDANDELTEQQKIMARAALIMDGLAAAQGDVIRTSDSFANRIRAVKENLSEIAVEIGERVLPMAERLVGWFQDAIEWARALPGPVKAIAAAFVIFAASIGPVIVVMTTLIALFLPFFIKGRLVLTLISALINPVGTLVAVLTRLAISTGLLAAGLGAAFAAIAPLALAVAGLTVIMWALARASQAAAAAQAEVDERAENAAQSLAELQGMAARVGLSLHDSAVAGAENVSVLESMRNRALAAAAAMEQLGISARRAYIFSALAQGQEAHRAIQDREAAAGLQNSLFGAEEGYQARLAREAQNRQDLATIASVTRRIEGAGRFTDSQFDEALADEAPPPPGSEDGKSGEGASGPTQAELAARRQALALEHAISVARAAGDLDILRALERQRDLQARIAAYRSAGLSQSQAEHAASTEMLALDEARALAQAERTQDEERRLELQLAEMRNDVVLAQELRDQEHLEERITFWQQEQYDLAEATRRANEELNTILAARADRQELIARAQREEFELELARSRGEDTRGREADLRRRDRIEQLVRGGTDPAEAEAQAIREGVELARADLQGTFRDTFRDGLQAALNGNLGQFFENWMRDRTFNALSNVLDRLADQLANLVSGMSGGKGGGGIFGAIAGLFGGGQSAAGLFGALGGGKGGSGAGFGFSTGGNIPAFDTGGSFEFRGLPGIDRNVLSMNGSPIARVSSGEIANIRKAGGGKSDAGSEDTLIIKPSPLFEAEIENRLNDRDARRLKAKRRIVRSTLPG